jgi:hypothetical protein
MQRTEATPLHQDMGEADPEGLERNIATHSDKPANADLAKEGKYTGD